MSKTEVKKIIGTHSPTELLELYQALEPIVLPLLDEIKEHQALDDLKHGRTYTISSVQELDKLCK